jgi:hypothetical protein
LTLLFNLNLHHTILDFSLDREIWDIGFGCSPCTPAMALSISKSPPETHFIGTATDPGNDTLTYSWNWDTRGCTQNLLYPRLEECGESQETNTAVKLNPLLTVNINTQT